MRRFKRAVSLLVLLFVLGPHPLLAQDTGLTGVDLEFHRPALDANGFFAVNGARLQPRGRFSLQVSQSFAFGPVFQVSDPVGTFTVVDRVFTTVLSGSAGLADFVSFGVALPFHLHAREGHVATLGAFDTGSLGDIGLSGKWRLLEERGLRPGLSLLTTLTLPTGDSGKFLGTRGVVPGGDLLIEKGWKLLRLAVNLGAAFPGRTDLLGIRFDDYFRYGAAVEVPLRFFDPHFTVIAEVRGRLPFGDPGVLTSPVEFTAGVRKAFRNGLSLSAAAGGALNDAIGNPRVRALVTVSFAPPRASRPPETKAPRAPLKVPSGPIGTKASATAHFLPESSKTTDESAALIRETARILKGNPRRRVVLECRSAGRSRSRLRLSHRRLEAVYRNLLAEGVPPSRIQTRACQPPSTPEPTGGNGRKDRVDILLGY